MGHRAHGGIETAEKKSVLALPLRPRAFMKTLVKVFAPLVVAAVVAACSSTTYYPGVASPQARCLERGSTCYYGTDCCSLTCTNNLCVSTR